METMFGVVVGYVLRGTTGSQGFRELVESARAVTDTREFQNMLHAAKSHAAHVVKDLSETLSQGADQLADVLTAGVPAAGAVEPAEWEKSWPPPPRRPSRPFSEDVTWPNR